MQKHPSWGLLTAGPASRLETVRLPVLLKHLGPVKAKTYREASLAVRAIRAGEPARDYAALDACRHLLLFLPEGQAAETAKVLRRTAASVLSPAASWKVIPRRSGLAND